MQERARVILGQDCARILSLNVEVIEYLDDIITTLGYNALFCGHKGETEVLKMLMEGMDVTLGVPYLVRCDTVGVDDALDRK